LIIFETFASITAASENLDGNSVFMTSGSLAISTTSSTLVTVGI
jgi:hypothetical protein